MGLAVAIVLLLDALLHLYWATGATWPAADEYSLSVAILGFGVDFRPGLLVPLAVLLAVGAVLVLARGLLGREHRFGLVWQAGAVAVTVGALARALLGVMWAFPALGYLPAGFYWANLLGYVPLCLGTAAAGFVLLRTTRVGSRSRPWRSARVVALALPVILVASLLYGAYGFSPRVVADYDPAQQLGNIPSRYVDTALAEFHYVRQGQGPPVVLLSPGASWVAAWEPQIRALSATHTVYVVDLPGQGLTTLHDDDFVYDLNGMTLAVGVFLDAVRIDRVALGGSSWSGGWALAFAQRYPGRVSRLLLLAPSGLDRKDPLSWEVLKLPVIGRALTQLGAMSRSTSESGLRGLFLHQGRVSPELVDGTYAMSVRPANVRSMYELEARLDWSAVERSLPTTRQPTLVLWGRQDSVLPVENAAVFGALLPDATVSVLDQCGHGLPLDCPDRVSAQMAEFLRVH